MDSEQQFLDMVEVLALQVNKILGSTSQMLPIGLLYNASGNIDSLMLSADDVPDLQSGVNLLQATLQDHVADSHIQATCIAYPDYENLQIVCLLENRENYCAKYLVPVTQVADQDEEALSLVLDEIEYEQSYVYIFPLNDNAEEATSTP